MHSTAVAIPEKIFFKIGEVCDLTGVQAHVLRYWESEFPMLSPQKNRAGQRTYRRRDVEIALRIRELLYDEMYTIAGARKRLGQDLRGASKLKVVTPDMVSPALGPETPPRIVAQPLLPSVDEEIEPPVEASSKALSTDQIDALRGLATELQALLELLGENGNGAIAR
ncbi:MAG: MerR family transcriptional regulator [Pyrinomonadaceae bacterium]